MAESIELIVHNSNDLTVPIGVIALRTNPTVLDELNREGGCGFKLPADQIPILDDGTVLEEGKVIRVRVGGQDVSMWEIQKVNTVLIDKDEQTSEYLSYSGPSLYQWLSHGVVMPESGIASVSDERSFNYSAKRGSWYVASAWKNAVSNGSIVSASALMGTPKSWPKKLTANWLWDRAITTSAPAGDVYFRREFTTSKITDFTLVGTADDFAVVLINGQQVMAITEFGAKGKTFSTDVTLPSGNHVLAVKARNVAPSSGTKNPAGLVLAMCTPGEKQVEDLTDADRYLWTGDDLSQWKVNGYPTRPPGFTIGGILKVLRDEAVGRGVTTLGQTSLGFTELVDSYGVPWQSTVDPSFKVGATLLEVVKQVTDTYADVWMGPDLKLHAAPARGVDRSVSVSGRDPVAFRKAQNVTAASVDSTSEIANTLFMKTSSGIKESPGPAGSLSKYGRRETFISAVTASQDGTAPYLAGQVFSKYAYPRRTPTVSILATDLQVPFNDFRVGDWVLAPSDTNANKLVKRRVVSISVGEDDNGLPEYTVEIDTIQITTQERLARWLEEQGNGSKSGGVSGTSSLGQSSGDIPPVGGNSGNRPLPIPPDSRRPNPPTALQLSSDTGPDDRGYIVGTVSFRWQHDGKATDGTTLDTNYFSVYYRPSGVGEFRLLTQTPGKEGGYRPLSISLPGGGIAKYEMYVDVTSVIGTTSFASGMVEVAMTKDTTPPIQPQPPLVTCERAVFTVMATDKDMNGAPMAVDLSYYVVQHSTNGTTWTKWGTFNPEVFAVVADMPYGVRHFRLIAVDHAGNASTASTATISTSAPLVDTDVILTELDAAKTQIKNAGNLVLESGVQLGVKLSENDTAIAEAKAATTVVANSVDAVGTALAATETKAQAAKDAAATANSAAGTAKATADQAKADALAAAGLAGSKGEVIYQATAPTGSRANAANLWVRSSDNAPHTYDTATSKWVIRTDKAATDAAAAAAAARTAASNAAADAQAAMTKAGQAQASADGKNNVYYVKPTGTAQLVKGDTWFDAANGNRVNQWTGSKWEALAYGEGAIENLAITNAKIASLDGAKISAETITGVQIKAGAVTTNKLLVGDFTNLAALAPDADAWDYVAGNSAVSNVSYSASSSGRALRFQGSANITSIYGKKFTASPGESLYVEATFRSDGGADATGRLTLGLAYYDAADAIVGWDIYATYSDEVLSHASRKTLTAVSKVPVGVAYARPLASTREARATADPAKYAYLIDPIIRRMTTGELIVDGSITAAKVDAESVAAKLGTFIKLNVDQLTATGTANIDTAVVNKLWTDVVRSRKITTDMMLVGQGANMLIDPNFLSEEACEMRKGNASDWRVHSDGTRGQYMRFYTPSIGAGSAYFNVTPVMNSAAAAPDKTDWLPVTGGEVYGLTARIYQHPTAEPRSRIYVNWEKSDGTTGSSMGPWVTGTGYQWLKLDWEVAEGTRWASIRIATEYVANPVATMVVNVYAEGTNIVRKTDASLIVDGTILSRHMTTDSITARELKALSVSAGHIAANTITGDKINAGSVKAVILTASSIIGSMISGTAIDGKIITGATVRTNAGAATVGGIQFDVNSIRAWAPGGEQTFYLSANTGDLSLKGDIRSGFLNGNQFWAGGDMRGSGATGVAARPGIVFKSDATEYRAAAIYRDGEWGAIMIDSPYSDTRAGYDGRSSVSVANNGFMVWASKRNAITGPGNANSEMLALNASNDDWLIGGGGTTSKDDFRIKASGGWLSIRRNSGHIIEMRSDRSTVITTSKLDVAGSFYATSKNFKIRHPSKDGMDLYHGSTESPVSGIEYWGENVIGAEGEVLVDLPDYFEALAKPGGRAAFVQAIETPGAVTPSRIVDGSFKVTGAPGQPFTWHVLAERYGADFEIEQPTDLPTEEESTEWISA